MYVSPSTARTPTATSPFAPGRNCWRTATASRVAVLIDAAAYFDAVSQAIERARQSVLILSWDIDSRTPLAGGQSSQRLGALLHSALARRPGLHVHVLNWDFAFLYMLEREVMPAYRREWRAHPRLHFHADGTHPLGACHHQKVVVVDDAIGFTGGLDICARRWDTSAHDPADPRRVDLSGVPYPPFHDVQIAVEGPAARALGELARSRWHHATGDNLPAPHPHPSDHWPVGVSPDFVDVEVAIVRTMPGSNGDGAVREVETLFLDTIHRAQRWIYVENQYLTSTRIADALAARLSAPTGPEIVLVVPREGCGWLEEQTMSMRRQRTVERLHAADHHDRLRIYAPVIDGEVIVNVHSKVMVVDDALLRVGSANLSNRSMAVDTECDVALAASDDDTAEGIAAVRDRLLADHLGATPTEVATATAETGSLIAAIERLRGRAHTLEPLPIRAPGWLDGLPNEAHVFDPPEPIEPARLLTPPRLGTPPLAITPSMGLGLCAAIVLGIGLGRGWPRPRLIGAHA